MAELYTIPYTYLQHVLTHFIEYIQAFWKFLNTSVALRQWANLSGNILTSDFYNFASSGRNLVPFFYFLSWSKLFPMHCSFSPGKFFKAPQKTLPQSYFFFFTIVKDWGRFSKGGGNFSNHLKNIQPWGAEERICFILFFI